MGAARKIAGNKRGPVANIAKQATDVFGKFGKLPIFGKITGIFTKLAKPLGWIGARSSTLLATASRFVPFLGRFAGAFGALGAIGGPVTAVIMGTVGALKALKEAPKALVKWKYEWKDKLAELGSLSVEWIKAGMKKGADAVVAAAGWTKDLVVDGLLGAGSFLVGLTGRETAFERQYKLDKQQQALADRKKSVQDAEEEALKREQHLLDLRNSVVDSRNQTTKNTDRDYLKEKASDSFKLYEAKIALGKTEAQQNAKEKEINEIYDGVWRLDKKLVAAEDKIGETNQEIVAINVGKKKTESGRELNDAEKEKALTQARADNATAVNERNEIDKQISGLVAKAETIQKEMGPLNETWAKQRRAVLELTDAVEAKNREFQAASDAVTKQLTQQEEALKDYSLSVAVDMAQTKADEADARKKILARTNEKIGEAQAAGEAANDKTKRIDDVFKFLTKESSAFFTAGVGSVVGANKNVSDNVEEQSAKDKDDIAAISGALSVFSRSAIGDSKVLKDFALSVRPDVEGKTELDDLGATEIMRKGKVEEFYQALLAAQEEEWRNIDGLAKERDALLAKAQELPALLKERNSESAEIKETEKEIQTRANERLEADEKRTERQQEANKSVWETQRNEAFSRRLNAAPSNPEKMALLSYRHALSGAEANAEIGGLSAKISEFDEEIKSLDERDAKGELNEEERARRDKLVEKREEAEGKRNSVYAEAINERIGIENQAKSVAENWAQEQANKYKENQQRFAQAQKEDQKGISGQSAIKAGSSQAFAMTSRIYDQGTKTTQKSVEKIEETTKRMVEYLSRYLMSNSQGFALDFNG